LSYSFLHNMQSFINANWVAIDVMKEFCCI